MTDGQMKFALLIEGANSVTSKLAKNLLEEVGIPVLLKGPDFDVVELGQAAHDNLRGTDVLVPSDAFERAREVLDAAWGPQVEGGEA